MEERFDRKTRLFTAALFLTSRGLSAGITIFAPAIVLSAAIGVPLNTMIIIIGAIVVVYTVSGGSAAVAVTQKWQMTVILLGMAIAATILINLIPVSMYDAYHIAGNMGKLNIVSTSFDPGTRYTLWSGLAGGLFLSLSYLGTDQSQVQRYLGAEDERSSKFGLLFNATFKVPMQFAILAIGVLLFVFYQFVKPPVFFNQSEIDRAPVEIQQQLQSLELEHALAWDFKREALVNADWEGARYYDGLQEQYRASYMDLLDENLSGFQPKDTDYVFITFILENLPNGLIGLLLAVIISAAMSSTAGEVSALATTTYVDYFQVFYGHKDHDEKRTIRTLVLIWGIAAILVALAAPLYENLIQLVNVLGSLFYGTILGIFLVGLFLKKVAGNQVFVGGLIAQATIFICHYLNSTGVLSIGFLWYNVIATLIVIGVSLLLHVGFKRGTVYG